MKIRIYNARILTMAEDMSIIDGELHTDGERIAFVGDRKDRKSVV